MLCVCRGFLTGGSTRKLLSLLKVYAESLKADISSFRILPRVLQCLLNSERGMHVRTRAIINKLLYPIHGLNIRDFRTTIRESGIELNFRDNLGKSGMVGRYEYKHTYGQLRACHGSHMNIGGGSGAAGTARAVPALY